MTHVDGEGKREDGSGRPVVRFAPSPTGRLHLGHALAALFAYGFAQAVGARFLLRIEDTDTSRCRPEFTSAILDDLAWLGLEWETPVLCQSEHFDVYREAMARLDGRGLIHRCYATRRELRDFAERAGTSWPRDPDGSPLHPGPGRVPDAATASARAGAGELPALRLDMNKAAAAAEAAGLVFEDIGIWVPEPGRIVADPDKWGDVVLGRKDTGTSYHLSVVVDDAAQGVTHVVRGLDLYEASHLHRLLQSLLGLPAPLYCHHPLILDGKGAKLSKAIGSESLAAWRNRGGTPADIRAAVELSRFDAYFETLAAGAAGAPMSPGPANPVPTAPAPR